ncbi:MAG: DUF362 domain-containing protein [Desulfobacteraceae bacterium]|nr:MAG: DUF362 domain-containing protein [Desulfobacteraceae bacterium]
MAEGIQLKKGRFSAKLSEALRAYYRPISEDPVLLGARLNQKNIQSNSIFYRVSKGPALLGWVVYDPETSTIEELVPSPPYSLKKIVVQMLDALIAAETQVSAHVLASDTEKYAELLAYGFRPVRSFNDKGLAFVGMELSTSVLLHKLKNKKPARPYRKQEKVAIEKVPETQTPAEIKESLTRLLAKLGGIDTFVAKGQTVVIKPNIVSDHGLKDGVLKPGIVTDIRVVQALVELLLPIAKQVIIAEGSSINRSETAKMFALYGYDRLVDLDPKKVKLVDLNTDKLIEKPVPAGKRMRSRKIPVTLDKADVIINLPVLKNHFAAIASLAIKNLQGAMPPLEKYMSHFFGLWQNLVNIHHLIKPQLTIIDGLCGQEDFGPVSGTPKTMNLLIAGANPVAVDATAMRVMGLEPSASPPVFLAYMQGLGPIEKKQIKVLGPAITQVRQVFKQPQIDVRGGKDLRIHSGEACSGCRGYLHFVLAKLRKDDPEHPGQRVIDRSLACKANIFLGPTMNRAINSAEVNLFMGLCQQQHAALGKHLAGCPPHAEVIVNAVYGLFPGLEKPKYADETEEAKLGKLLEEILNVFL